MAYWLGISPRCWRDSRGSSRRRSRGRENPFQSSSFRRRDWMVSGFIAYCKAREGALSNLRQPKASRRLCRVGAYALAKWNRRARARRIQSRESAAADDDDPACLALAETSAAFGTGAMVQGTRQTQRRAPAQNDDRGACAQIVSRVVEICECRRRHRRRRNEGLLIDDLNRLTQSTETRSVSADRGGRIDGAYGLNSRQQEWSRPPEPHPPQAGYWCSRFARRPNVSLIWCGNDQVTEAGSNLGYRNSLRSFAYAPLNLALDPNIPM